MKTWNSDFSHEAAAFQQEVVVHLQISSVKKTQVLPYVWCLYCSAKDHRSGEIKPESVLIITEGLHDITLSFFCFLLYRIQELCPNHSGNYKPAAAFIRTQCLPETLKCLGFPNQKKQTQHLTKQLQCWIHLSVQEQNWFCKAVVVSFSATELLQIPYHHFLTWILGPTVFLLP